jgi:tetratricopeptide (TPR) repeat protein
MTNSLVTSVNRGTRKALGCVLLLSAVLLAVATSFAQGAAEVHANKGLELAQRGDLRGAELKLRQAAKLAPSNAEILGSLGTVLAMEEKLEESNTVLGRALKLKPTDLTLRRYLAANFWQLQRYAEAKRNLQIILKQKPSDPPTLLLMGMVSENMQDYATAAKMLSAVPALVRQQPESIAALARSYYHLSNQQKAREMLGQMSPSDPQAILLSSQIADEMRDYAEAEKLLLSIQSTPPDPAAIGYGLALVRYHAKRVPEARQTLLELINAGHKTGAIYNLLGWCYQDEHQLDRAVAALEEAARLDPQQETNYLDLAKIYIANGKIPSALLVVKRGAAALPDSPRIVLLRGSIELKVGQFTDALASYTHAQQLSNDPDGALGIARAQFGAGMIKEAAAGFESGMKRFPKDARFPLHYALLLLKQSETGDASAEMHAETLLKSALALDRSLPEAHYHLGDLALKNGRNVEAVAHLESAEKLDPENKETHFALSRAYRHLGRPSDSAREMDLYNKLKDAETALVPAP